MTSDNARDDTMDRFASAEMPGDNAKSDNMSRFTSEELSEAHRALRSTLQKCEKMDRGKLGKSQRTLLERRVAALKIALALIEKEQEVSGHEQ
jgi:hypothetical protein